MADCQRVKAILKIVSLNTNGEIDTREGENREYCWKRYTQLLGQPNHETQILRRLIYKCSYGIREISSLMNLKHEEVSYTIWITLGGE